VRWRSGILHLSLPLFRPYLIRWADEGVRPYVILAEV